MAEILISLTIIGIIAAITLPALRANINEATWRTQRKALYSRMSQAIAMMPSINGYGIGTEVSKAAQLFITDGLAKVLQINNICDNNHFKDCGIVSKYKNGYGIKKDFPTTLKTLKVTLAGSGSYSHPTVATAHDSYSLPDLNAAAFETKNGESIAVFYQPYCRDNLIKGLGYSRVSIFTQPLMCANFIFDLNGKKGPNRVGKDMGFITAFYPTDSEVVMPEPLLKDTTDENGNYELSRADALRICARTDKNLRIPSKEEFSAVSINSKFLGISANGEVYILKDGWSMVPSSMRWLHGLNYPKVRVRCIKR